jgi:hypothetical protein
MNRKNTKSLRKVNTSLTHDEKLILVRDGVFNYLQFLPTSQQVYNSNPVITAKPTITIKNSGVQTVLLDYSNANPSNKEILDNLFNNVISGETFGFSNANHVNPIKGTNVELEAVLQFKSYRDYIIKTETVGATLSTPLEGFYDPVYFLESPTITFNTVNSISQNSKNKINQLKNTVPSDKTNNLLKYLGIVPGNYIKIVNSDSTNNDTMFRVVEYSNGEYEHLILDPAPEYENLTGEPTLIKVFAPTKQPEAIQNIPFSNDWGCAAIQAGNTLEYFPYFTRLQAEIKKQEYLNPKLTFYPNTICSNQAVVNNIPITTGTLETVTSQSTNTTKIDIVFNRNQFYPTIQQIAPSTTAPSYSILRATLTIDVNGIYEFTQSDSGNAGNTFRLSSVNTNKEPVFELNGVTNFITPNSVGTVITLDAKRYVETTGTNTVYAYSEQNPNIGFTINIIGDLPVSFRNIVTGVSI